MRRLIPLILIISFLLPLIPAYSAPAEESGPKTVALTFDDGPHPRITEKILDYLDSEQIKATFFIIGVNAELWPDIVKDEISRGHEIGNHTYSHDEKKRNSREEFASDLSHADSILHNDFGYETVLFRPPQGICNDNVMNAASELEYSVVLWNIDTHDWAHNSTENIVSTVMKKVKNGDIILFHDYVSGESHTLDALRVIVPRLKSEGYTFATVSELLAQSKPVINEYKIIRVLRG